MKLQFSRTFAILTQNREALKLRAGTALQSAARWGRSNQRRFIAFCHPAPSRQPLTLATLRWWREPSNPIHSRMFFFLEVVKRDSSVLLDSSSTGLFSIAIACLGIWVCYSGGNLLKNSCRTSTSSCRVVADYFKSP